MYFSFTQTKTSKAFEAGQEEPKEVEVVADGPPVTMGRSSKSTVQVPLWNWRVLDVFWRFLYMFLWFLPVFCMYFCVFFCRFLGLGEESRTS